MSVLATSAAVATAILLALCAPASATTPFTGTLAGAGELTLAGSATPSDETVGLLTAVSNTSVVPSTTAADATGVAYTVTFTTSSTGQLMFPGTVTLTGPAGTFTDASFTIFDVTEQRTVGGGIVSNDGATVVLRVTTSTATGAGDQLRVSVTNATNSGAGSHSFAIETSSDTDPVTTSEYVLVAAQAVSGTSVVPSTTAAGATGVAYAVTFTTSSTGQLVFPGTVTLTGPAGTFTNASFTIFNVTENRTIGGSIVSNEAGTVQLRITTSTPTGAG